jgi:RNA polymerase sigma factor (sigma-70 family)
MSMQMTQSNRNVHETCVPMLRGAQSYLKALVNDTAPDSLVSSAWDDFYRVYDDLIRRFAIAQGVPRSDVDDCVQDVWSEVAARLAKFDRPADRPGLRSWLFALVRSKATNLFRKKARQPQESLDERIGAGYEPGDAQDDPAMLFEHRWEQAVLDSMVAQLHEELSSTNSRILRMRLIEGSRVEDVAGELNLAPEQVYARQHRILKKLRARVASLAPIV